MSFSIYLGLTIGAYNAIEQFGSDTLKETFFAEYGLWEMERNDVPH